MKGIEEKDQKSYGPLLETWNGREGRVELMPMMFGLCNEWKKKKEKPRKNQLD